MMAAGCALGLLVWITTPYPIPPLPKPAFPPQQVPYPKLHVYVDAYVTGFNTVVSQTDRTPCIAASGAYICGRRDAIACPRLLKFGTVVEIKGKKYVCEDRTARRLNGRFDISCDKDKNCPYEVAGWTTVEVLFE